MKTKHTQHTPGPWRHQVAKAENQIGYDSFIVPNTEPGDWIARVAPHGPVEANARLIASAPALLAALQDCERLLGILNAPGTNDPIESAVFKARAAIAKATQP